MYETPEHGGNQDGLQVIASWQVVVAHRPGTKHPKLAESRVQAASLAFAVDGRKGIILILCNSHRIMLQQ